MTDILLSIFVGTSLGSLILCGYLLRRIFALEDQLDRVRYYLDQEGVRINDAFSILQENQHELAMAMDRLNAERIMHQCN